MLKHRANKQILTHFTKAKGTEEKRPFLFEFIMFWEPAGIYALICREGSSWDQLLQLGLYKIQTQGV